LKALLPREVTFLQTRSLVSTANREITAVHAFVPLAGTIFRASQMHLPARVVTSQNGQGIDDLSRITFLCIDDISCIISIVKPVVFVVIIPCIPVIDDGKQPTSPRLNSDIPLYDVHPPLGIHMIKLSIIISE